MKPSQRLHELNKDLPCKGQDLGNGSLQFQGYESAINTIIDYLDEEYTKKLHQVIHASMKDYEKHAKLMLDNIESNESTLT